MKLNKNEISTLQRRAGIKSLTEGDLDMQDLGREHAEQQFLRAVNDLVRAGYQRQDILSLIDDTLGNDDEENNIDVKDNDFDIYSRNPEDEDYTMNNQ